MTLSNFDQLIYNYVIQRILEKFPDVPVYPGTPMNDLLVVPQMQLFNPLVELIDKVALKQNLANASLMTEEELNDVASGLYFMSRNVGVKASGFVYVSFRRPLSDVSNILVPAGTMFSVDGGNIKFTAPEDTLKLSTDLPLYYNVYQLTYDIPVYVEAVDVGDAFNVEAQQITTIESVLTNSVSVTNRAAFVNGTNKETNEEFAARIKSSYLGRKLGTKTGYTQFVLQNFPAAIDALTVGFGDAIMTRDIGYQSDGVTTVKDNEGNTKHFGGKSDVYIRGTSPTSATDSFRINSNYMYLSQIPDANYINNIIVSNDTNPNVTPGFNLVAPSQAGDKYKITITSGAVANDHISATYRWVDTEGVSLLQTDSFVYMTKTLSLTQAPLIGLVSVVNNTQADAGLVNASGVPLDSSISINSVTTTLKSDLQHSKREGCKATFANATLRPNTTDTAHPSGVMTYDNGDLLTVTYTYDKLIADVQDSFDVDDNRIITTDVLARQASKRYMYCQVKVRLQDGRSLGSQEQSAIQNTITDYINSVKFSGEVQASDIINAIYRLSTGSIVTDYIVTPIILYGITTQQTSLNTANFTDPADSSKTVNVTSTKVKLDTIEYPVPGIISVLEAGADE